MFPLAKKHSITCFVVAIGPPFAYNLVENPFSVTIILHFRSLSNPDTLGSEESVLISAVVKSTQTWHLGQQQQQQKVSCLSRCPDFSGCKEHTNMAFGAAAAAAAKSVLFIEVS